ncbi:MAG: apolipoprotein N-acyltransferase [Desulfobacterales bacterium]
MKPIFIEKYQIVSAVFSGLLLTAAFPPIGMHWVAWAALVPLLTAAVRQTVFNSFRLGVLAGLTHYVSLMYWLAFTIHTYGHLPWALSIPIMLLLAFFLSLFIGVFCAAVSTSRMRPVVMFLLIPTLWVFLEYVRSFLLSGFPWALLGYSQSENLHLIQISDITGVYGVSFVIAAVNGLIVMLVRRIGAEDRTGKMSFSGTALLSTATTGALVLVLIYGDVRLDRVNGWMTAAPHKTVVAVQGNIDQNIKWDDRFQMATTRKYIDLSLSAKPENPDLIVWPETAAPFYFLYDKDPVSRALTEMVLHGISAAGSDFLIGSPSFSYDRQQGVRYYNSAYLVQPDKSIAGKYDKVHLVPFGEYVPLRKWIPFVGKIVEHIGDFEGGEKGTTLVWQQERLGILICYEIIFPDLSRAATKNGASLLLNITNDAWYGRTGAPYQHFSKAVFRAVENRRSLVRSANTGISGFIDPTGRANGKTGLYVDATASFSVPLIHEKTFYTRFGDLFARICTAIAAGLVIINFLAPGPKTRS